MSLASRVQALNLQSNLPLHHAFITIDMGITITSSGASSAQAAVDWLVECESVARDEREWRAARDRERADAERAQRQEQQSRKAVVDR